MFSICAGTRVETHKGDVFAPIKNEENVSSSDDEPEEDDNAMRTTPILLDVVGAIGLDSIQPEMDSYCVVKIGNANQADGKVDWKEVHRTKPVYDDPNPIWTIETKGLKIIHVMVGNIVCVDLCYNKHKLVGDPVVIGSVSLKYSSLIQGNEERHEVQFQHNVSFSLKYRKATSQECMWLSKDTGRGFGFPSLSQRFHAGDLETRDAKPLYAKNRQAVTNPQTGKSETQYRVWPFPNPDNPKETTFLSKQRLCEEARKPSARWVESGSGSYGTLDVEFLGCDGLPNMDADLIHDKTDTFAVCIYEDSLVWTNVIHDTLNPRFMPWSTRAFRFQIAHPSSILFLGIFDYDEVPLDTHDPIGRVVIHTDEFENDTMYTLTYPLYHGDTKGEKQRGTVTLRIRVSWSDISEMSKAMAFITPPRFTINTKSNQSFEVVRYVTRGSIDMKQATIPSVKQYASELASYIRKYCYLLDVAAEILLWRGRCQVGRRSVWFPLHSIALFSAVTASMEYSELIPSILLYAIAYSLLAVNYHSSHHPNPWKRVRSYRQINEMSLLGRGARSIEIKPHSGEQEGLILDRLDVYKRRRVICFLQEIKQIMLSVYRIYSKTVPLDLSTLPSTSGSILSSFYASYLSYVYMALKANVRMTRLLRNFVNWKSYSTFRFTTNCLLLATAWCFFPFKLLVFRCIKVLLWLCFGPSMKIVDLLVFRPYYRTKEELLRDGLPEDEDSMIQEIEARPSILDGLLEKDSVQAMIYSGRVVAEESEKLKAFRRVRFGSMSETIPPIDGSRYPGIPVGASFAQPYVTDANGQDSSGENVFKDLANDEKMWTYVPGQRLEGGIFPRPINPNVVTFAGTAGE